MSEMFDVYLQNLDRKGLANSTINNYKATWSTFRKWMLRTDPDLQDAGHATQKDIADFKRHMMEHGGKGRGPAKPSTMHLTFVHLNAIFQYFTDQKLIPDNPVGPVKKPPAPRRTPKWLSRNEQNAILREIRKSGTTRDYALVMMMLRAGLRVHETCDLLKSELQVGLRSGSAYIRGKGYKDREVPLNAEVRSSLESYLKGDPSDSPYVFASQRSSKLSVRAVQHMVEKYRDRTKIENLSCHGLRHTFGHDLVSAGNDLQKVAMLMGHYKEDGTPNIEMTMIYTTPGVEDLEAAVESISWT